MRNSWNHSGMSSLLRKEPFSSANAKKSFIANAIAKGMKLDGDNVLGFDDFVDVYKKNDAAAFSNVE